MSTKKRGIPRFRLFVPFFLYHLAHLPIGAPKPQHDEQSAENFAQHLVFMSPARYAPESDPASPPMPRAIAQEKSTRLCLICENKANPAMGRKQSRLSPWAPLLIHPEKEREYGN